MPEQLFIYLSSGSPITIPSGVFATPLDSAVVVSWNSIGTAVSYDVQISTDNVFTSPTTVNVVAPDVTQVFGGLSNGTTYYFRVRTVQPGGGTSEWSNVVSAVPAIQTGEESSALIGPEPNYQPSGNSVPVIGVLAA